MTAWPKQFNSAPYLRWFDPETWNCGHLVLEFYRRELGIELPDYAVGQFGTVPMALRAAWKAAALNLARQVWLQVDAPFFGAVAVFGEDPRYDGHVGVMIEPLRVLHVVEDAPTTVSRIDGPGWGPTLRGFYRWAG